MRILLFRPGALGDVLLLRPGLLALQKIAPSVEVRLCAPGARGRLAAERLAGADVFDLDRADAAWIYGGNGPPPAALAASAGAPDAAVVFGRPDEGVRDRLRRLGADRVVFHPDRPDARADPPIHAAAHLWDGVRRACAPGAPPLPDLAAPSATPSANPSARSPANPSASSPANPSSRSPVNPSSSSPANPSSGPFSGRPSERPDAQSGDGGGGGDPGPEPPADAFRPLCGDLGAADALARAGLAPGAYAVLHPGSGSPAKNLPLQHFVTAGEAIRAGGWHGIRTGALAIVAGEADGDLGARLAAALPEAVLLPPLALPTLAGVLHRAAGYAGNDSGVSHLAGLTGTPTVAAFRTTDPRLWRPWGPRVTVLDRRADAV